MLKSKDKQVISKLNYFFNSHRKYINIVVMVVVIIVGLWLVVWPKWSEISYANQNRVPELRLERDNKANYLAKLNQLDKRLGDLTADSAAELDKINRILPDKADIQSLFVELERLTVAAGFALQKVSINEVKIDTNDLIEFQVEDLMDWEGLPDEVKAVDVGINVAGGGYNQFKQLIERIEKNSRLFNIITINFSSLSDPSYVGREGQEIVVKDYSFNIRTYYLDQANASQEKTK